MILKIRIYTEHTNSSNDAVFTDSTTINLTEEDLEASIRKRLPEDIKLTSWYIESTHP